jgi:formimidoylglutamate deiminase
LSDRWARDVIVDVSEQGFITGIETASAHAGASGQSSSSPQSNSTMQSGAAALSGGSAHHGAFPQRIDGIVVPGMPNAHSHAFQRAMAGNTEFRLSARDSFWTWRQAMYALANRIEPDDLEILATQLFMEMLKSGYTSVAEFHYLHRGRDGVSYPGTNPLWEAIDNAASAAGIALTFLPTLYQTSDFGGKPLKPEQARFASETDAFLRAVGEKISADRRGREATRRTGAAFHSLRAVPLDNLRRAALSLRDMDATLPVHIHVAEQRLEVEACVRETGRRPIELLLDTGLVDRHWCLVHATHATGGELKSLCAAAASVCVSVSTEANLGDGFFDTARFLKAGGRLCVGSDSQCSVNPAEELRWLEYQQRLRKRRRGVLAAGGESHVGTRLWRDAARCGAAAIGQPAGAIELGARADWLVLDDTHPSMAGAAADTALDHLLFAGGDAAIRDVMVAGRWVIKQRHHAAEDELRPRFAALMRRLAAPA